MQNRRTAFCMNFFVVANKAALSCRRHKKADTIEALQHSWKFHQNNVFIYTPRNTLIWGFLSIKVDCSSSDYYLIGMLWWACVFDLLGGFLMERVENHRFVEMFVMYALVQTMQNWHGCFHLDQVSFFTFHIKTPINNQSPTASKSRSDACCSWSQGGTVDQAEFIQFSQG